MAGYEDTKRMIIDTLMGRDPGTEIMPENHQAFALNMLDYIRSVEMSSASTLIGIAEGDTTPIQPDNARVAYIAGVAQERTVTFVNFHDINGQPISITTGEMEAVFVILLWNTAYWTYQVTNANIISAAENANFRYYLNMRKTYASVAAMNADVDSHIADDGTPIRVGETVAVHNTSNPSENAIYSLRVTSEGVYYWQEQATLPALDISGMFNQVNANVNYLECSQNAEDEIKIISDTYFSLSTHMRLLVKMTNTNTHPTPKLNINNTGAKSIWYNGAVATDVNTWDAGEILDVYYDGTNYQLISIKDKLIESVNVGSQSSAINAFNSVPTTLRRLGLKVTYYDTVNTKWITKQYIGSNLSGWNSESNWQGGIDDEPTAGSSNLVKSSGIYDKCLGRTTFILEGKGDDYVKDDGVIIIKDHKYRVYLDNTNISFSEITSTPNTILFVIGSYDYDYNNGITLYRRNVIDKTTKLRDYYDIIAPQSGYLRVGFRANNGEILKITVEDITQTQPEDIQTYTPINGYINQYGTVSYINSVQYAIFNVFGYDYVRFLGILPNTLPNSTYGFYDENDNLIYLGNFEYNTSLQNSLTKEYVVKIPAGAYYFKTQVRYGFETFPEFYSNFYCYLGKENKDISRLDREINIASKLSNLILWQGSISGSSGKWISGGNHYIIPLSSEDKYVKIKANSTSSSYWCFLTSESNPVNSSASFATGISSNNVLAANSELEVIIPYDAKYLYIQDTLTHTRIPQILIISKATYNTFEGINMIPTNIQKNAYIGYDYDIVENDGYFICTYDVSGVDVVGVHGRNANLGVNIFYDSNDNLITHFRGRYSLITSEFNFNDVINVPNGAKTLKIGFAYNKGFSVMNCTNISKEEPRNMLTCKKISFLGDSITAGVGSSTGTSTQGYRWTSMFSRYYARCVENNLGNSGTCLCTATKNNRESERFITRVSSETIGDSDVIFIWGGTNDFSYDSKPIGDLFVEETITSNNYIGTKKRVAPTDTDTFSGALHELLSTVRTLNPTAKVIFLTSLNRGKWNTGAYSNKRPSSFEQNKNGDWIDDYNEAIHKICEFYAIPVIDINKLLNQNWAYDDSTSSPEILQSMDYDGIHPNDAGHKRIAEIVFSYVINNKLV